MIGIGAQTAARTETEAIALSEPGDLRSRKKIKSRLIKSGSRAWTRRELHSLTRLSKAKFYFINYGPKVHAYSR